MTDVENEPGIVLEDIVPSNLNTTVDDNNNTFGDKRKSVFIKPKFKDIFPTKSDLKDGLQKLFDPTIYKDVFQVSILSLLEVILISSIGIGYIIAVSRIPFTNEDLDYVAQHPSEYFNLYPVASIFFLAISLVVIVIGAGFFMLIYGFKKSYPLIYVTILPGVALPTLFFIFVAAGVHPWYYGLDVPFYGVLGILFLISAKVIAKRVKADNIPKIFAIPLIVHILIIGVYSFLIFPFYRTIESEVGRGAIRILVHPILCKINLVTTQRFIKKYKNLEHPHLANGIVFGILVESALFGRFMIATVGSPTAQAITSVLSAIAEIAVRVTAPLQKKLLDYLLARFLNKKPEIELDIDKDHNAQYLISSMVVEKSSIVTIPFLLHFFWKHRLVFNFSFSQTPPNLPAMIVSAVIQLIIDITTDFICTVGEVINKVPIIKIWRTKRIKYIIWEILNWIQMCTLIIYVLRTLPSKLYCKTEDPCTCNLFLQDSLFYFCNNT